jgi:hypothetical protein
MNLSAMRLPILRLILLTFTARTELVAIRVVIARLARALLRTFVRLTCAVTAVLIPTAVIITTAGLGVSTRTRALLPVLELVARTITGRTGLPIADTIAVPKVAI